MCRIGTYFAHIKFIVIAIAKYQSHDALVRDRVVNAAAMCTEIMSILKTGETVGANG